MLTLINVIKINSFEFVVLLPVFLSQVHESLQAMGSSADSCDSETTVTSFGEDLVTPTAQDQPL